MDIDLLLPFLTASMALTILPGPDILYVLTESITKGQKTGIAISAGLVSGVFIHTLLATTGVSLVLKRSELAYQLLSYIGATYLFYLAYLSAKEPQKEWLSPNNGHETTFFFWDLYKKGLLMNVLNPKVSLFFIAFLPQFVNPSFGNPTIQMLILGVIFMFQAFAIFSIVALTSATIMTQVRTPKFWKTTKWLKVLILTTLGFGLLLTS